MSWFPSFSGGSCSGAATHYGCNSGGYAPINPEPPFAHWPAGRWDWYPPVTPKVGGACCAECAQGKTCAGEKAVEVGRSKPNSEIAEFEELITKLKADVNHYEPKAGDATDTANWAAINHALNGFVLRWGQFKLAQTEDWWWGDDDEAALATLKAEYNKLREDFLKFTSGKTAAPPAVVVPPAVKEEEKKATEKGPLGQQFVDVAKGLLWAGGLAMIAIYAVPPIAGRLLSRKAKSA